MCMVINTSRCVFIVLRPMLNAPFAEAVSLPLTHILQKSSSGPFCLHPTPERCII